VVTKRGREEGTVRDGAEVGGETPCGSRSPGRECQREPVES
jgi:hypothetical protein